MNFWRRLPAVPAVLAVIFLLAAMTVDFFDLVKTHHDDEVSREASQKQAEQAEIEIICAAQHPRSAVSRLLCAEGKL